MGKSVVTSLSEQSCSSFRPYDLNTKGRESLSSSWGGEPYEQTLLCEIWHLKGPQLQGRNSLSDVMGLEPYQTSHGVVYTIRHEVEEYPLHLLSKHMSAFAWWEGQRMTMIRYMASASADTCA